MRAFPVPQYSTDPIGLVINVQGTPTNADTPPTVTITNTDTNTVTMVGTSTVEGVGTYQFPLTASGSSVVGNYSAVWTYTVNGVAGIYPDRFVITDQMPFWETLGSDEKQLVVNIVHRLDRSFDSTSGGPYLQETIQSGFNIYEDVAMIMSTEAIDYINNEFQPVFMPPYEIGLVAQKPFPSNWYGVLASQTYANFLKHIARNYIEQPTPQGMTAAWMDRRDYYNRWWQLYLFEKEVADKQLRQMKRQFMVGSKRSLLVAGGLIPRMFVNPARPHFMYAAVNMGGV